MSKFKRECQSALATALTIMLVLSMMMGVFSLSASADENNNFPTVLNKPVLVYRDAWWTNGTLSNNVFSTISIRLDDSNSNFNISDITDIRYHYTVEDDGISRDDQARWYIADRFGAVLVNVGTLISSYEGFSSNDDYFRSSTSRKQFLFVLESLGRSSLSLDVYFKNGDVMPIEVGVVDEKLVSSTRSTAWETAGSILVRLAHSKLIEDEDFYSLGNAIAGVQSVNDNTTNKYYVDIDSKDEVKIPMNEMSDTVELVQTRVGSNVVYNSYGSVDFGDNIPSVSNGQADVGTVYYLPNGAYASNDDPTELVNYIQQKGIFYPVGEIHGNPINLWNFYADDSYDISSLYQENFGDFVDNLYFYSDFYTNLDGDSGSKTNEFAKILIYQKNYGGTNYNIGTDFESYPEGSFSYINSNGYHSLYPSYYWEYYSVTPFLLTFDGDHTSSVRFLNNLKSFLENNSNAPLTQYIKYNYFYGYTNNDYPVSYYYEDSERARSSSYQTGKGYGGTQRWFQLYYSYKDQYGKAQIGNTEILSSQDSTDVSSGIRRVINDFENNNYTDETLLNIYFTPADFNKKKALFIPDEKAYQAYDQLIAIAENSGLTIKNSQSIMPRRDYENCEKISFKDLITSLGVEIGTAQEQRVRPYLTYYYNSYDEETKTTGSWDYADPNKTHALHEDYELVQYGDFVFNTKDSSFPIITDTYYDTLFDSDNEKNEGDEPNPDPDPENTNSNEETKEENKREKGVKFKVDDIRTNIRKGVSYNVVNQVQLGLVSDYYASGRYGGKMYDTQYTDVGYGYNFVSNGNNSYSNGVLSDSNHDMRLGEWLGYSYTDDNGQKKMFTKGNVYYVGGEFITHSNTVTTGSHYFVGVTYDNDGFMNTTRIIDSVAKKYGTGPTTHWGVKDGRDAAMRNTEYKWGEMVFVSKPDPVVDLSYNKANQTISWNKPVDEGFGVKGKNKTATDDYIKIEDYTVKVTDETGKEVGSANIPRAGLNNVTYDICKLIKKSGTYKIAVTANNPIGDSKESILEDVVVYIADMDVKMTPDQPVHDEDDIVEFKETITNTGRVKLTNVIVYQSLTGEYVPQNGVTIKGSKASVAEIDVGKSVEILYRVPANKAKDGILTNTIEVTTNDQKLSETATASVKIIHHNIKMGLTAVSDKSVYTDENTVVIKSTIENKGEEILNDITVSNSIAGGKYTNLDNEKVTVMEDNNIIINTLDIGDTVTLNYEIPAKDIETGKNGAVQSTVNATNGKLSSSDLVEFKVVRPAITIKASPAKNEYNNDEDVTYTALIKNTGNIPLNDVTIGASIKGKFAENEFGQINSKGDMVISELPVGKSISLTYTVRSENTTFGTMNNTFTVSAKQDAMAEAETEIKVAFYGIDVMKTVDSETYVVGDTVVFHTKITNTGDGELKDIYITESTDGTFKLSEGALIYTDDTIVISAIKPGESYSYDFYVTATEDNIVDGVVSGESVVSVDDKLVGSDSASAKVYTQSLTFTKTVNEDNEYRRIPKNRASDTYLCAWVLCRRNASWAPRGLFCRSFRPDWHHAARDPLVGDGPRVLYP